MIQVIGMLCIGAVAFAVLMFLAFVALFYYMNIRTRIDVGYVDIRRLDGLFSAWHYVHRKADGFEEVARITFSGNVFIFQRRQDCETIYCCNEDMHVHLNHVVGTNRVDICDQSLPYQLREKSFGLPEIAADERCASAILSARKLYKECLQKSRYIEFLASRK